MNTSSECRIEQAGYVPEATDVAELDRLLRYWGKRRG